MNPPSWTIKAITYEGVGLICLTDRSFKAMSKDYSSLIGHDEQCMKVVEYWENAGQHGNSTARPQLIEE